MHANLSSPAAPALAVKQDSSLESLQVLSQNAVVLEKQHVDVKAEVLRKLTRLDDDEDGDSGGWGSWTASSGSNGDQDGAKESNGSQGAKNMDE